MEGPRDRCRPDRRSNGPPSRVVTTDSLSAVDSEVMPCTPAHSTRDARCRSASLPAGKCGAKSLLDVSHQSFQLLLVPGGQVGAGRHVMLEQKVPKARLFLREGQVRMRDPDHATVRVPLSLLDIRLDAGRGRRARAPRRGAPHRRGCRTCCRWCPESSRCGVRSRGRKVRPSRVTSMISCAASRMSSRNCCGVCVDRRPMGIPRGVLNAQSVRLNRCQHRWNTPRSAIATCRANLWLPARRARSGRARRAPALQKVGDGQSVLVLLLQHGGLTARFHEDSFAERVGARTTGRRCSMCG